MRISDRPKGLAREGILAAATHLFLDKGVDKASLSDIAKEAGVSKATLQSHFASKNDLIFAITEAHMETITRELLQLLERMRESPDRLFALLMTSLLEARDRGRLHLHLVREAVAGNPELREKIAETYARWEEMLAAALITLFPDHRAASDIAKLIIAIIDGCVIQELVREQRMDFSVLIEALIALNRPFFTSGSRS